MSAQSIRQRLKNRSDELGLEFQQALQYYAIERFLYRLSKTEWADQMIVKGATMLRVWQGVIIRPTRDIDFLSRLEDTEAQIQFVITIDVGIGDATVPGPEWVEYPVLLHGPAPRILTYSPETAIAEKYEAIVKLGLVNSRLKDYYDLWMLATTDSRSPSGLVAAVRATFHRRGTAIPDRPPVGLTPEFANQETTRQMWNALKMKLRKSDVDAPDTLMEVIEAINKLLVPVYKSGSEDRKRS